VFELRGSVSAFANAVQRVQGLELIDEQELEADEADKQPVLYLAVPDTRALQEIESLWRRWARGEELDHGYTAWRDVFSLLRNLRPWGPHDRIRDEDVDVLNEDIAAQADAEFVRLELELVYRARPERGSEQEAEVRTIVVERSGRVVSSARIDSIAYHALLVDLPVNEVRLIAARSQQGITGIEPIMFIRPQSSSTKVEVVDASEGSTIELPSRELGKPILAMLDGVPVAAHSLLSQHLEVDDPFELEPKALVTQRVHGTAIASLIVHGDLNRVGAAAPLPRKVHVVPVLGEQDEFPSERLIVDLVYQAVLRMREGPGASAPTVLIVNVSLGNRRRSFQGPLSPWARLLDRLAYDRGILFIVSAGNWLGGFSIPGFETNRDYEDAAPERRATETIRALGQLMAHRRILSPSETVNGLTIGASNEDSVSAADRRMAGTNVDPYRELRICNPSSALGPGFARSVKPEVLLAGGREHLHFTRSGGGLEMTPAPARRATGLVVAAPPSGGIENQRGYSGGTSAAAALASRCAHRIHDALEAAYGEAFLRLEHHHRAVLLKALLAHPASWPHTTAELIRATLGPPSGKQHVQQKDNIRRFLGYGVVDPEEAVACADDRATFWAVGTLQPDKVATIAVPVPAVMGGRAQPHALFVTLAWFTPTFPGRQSYRAVRLKVLKPRELAALAVEPEKRQPDENQANRGTLFKRCWSGSKAPAVGPNMSIELKVQREPDPGTPIDEAVPYGLAVTLTMPGVVELYDQIRQRLGMPVRPKTA
jgi:hypothetical protein